MCKKFCGKKDCSECFERSFASHHRSEWWSERNEIKPWEITKGTHKKFEFNCDICNHYFSSALNSISRGSWCPYCTNQKLCDNNDCNDCFNKSFASHPKAKYWSNNNKDKPRKIAKYNNNKFEFNCDTCNHSFTSLLSDISEGGWCPYCSNPPKKLCENSDCDDCFNKSFASHPKSKYWSNKNILKPRQIFKNTKKKYYFNCECKHDFVSSLDHISSAKTPKWCPYCCNPPQKLCDNNDCDNCFNNSFASHSKAKYWSESNTMSPRQIFKNSNKKYEFICNDCNKKFSSVVSSITRQYINPSWCPHCINKTERILFDYLSKKYLDIIRQYKPNWCKSNITNRCLPFDFFIPSLNIILELDGPQHFKQILNWDRPKHTQSKDLYKMKKAYDQKISILRIPYEYVCDDKIFEEYKDIIIQNLIIREKPEIIYLCNDDRYDHFKSFDFFGDKLPEIIPKE